MKHTIQLVVVLLVKAPRRPVPVFAQFLNLAVKQKVDGRLIVKSILALAVFEEFERSLRELLVPQFLQIQ